MVGGGFWGTAIARVAADAGASVTLIDSAEPSAASRAASGYYARSWYKGLWAERARAAESLGRHHGAVFDFDGADVVGRKARLDWATFWPEDVLALYAERAAGKVTRVERGRVHLQGGDVVEGGLVVLAAGVWTDQILNASGLALVGVEALGGRGLLFKAERTPARTMLVPVTSYFAYAARSWGLGVVRLGETLERDPSRAHDYTEKMRVRALGPLQEAVGTLEDRGSIWGMRPVLPEPTVREASPGIVVATGGGRVGGVLAWWAAAEVLRRLRG